MPNGGNIPYMERMFFVGLSENLVTQHQMVDNHSRSKGVMKYVSYPITLW